MVLKYTVVSEGGVRVITREGLETWSARHAGNMFPTIPMFRYMVSKPENYVRIIQYLMTDPTIRGEHIAQGSALESIGRDFSVGLAGEYGLVRFVMVRYAGGEDLGYLLESITQSTKYPEVALDIRQELEKCL
jgi:hypothetical protein